MFAFMFPYVFLFVFIDFRMTNKMIEHGSKERENNSQI